MLYGRVNDPQLCPAEVKSDPLMINTRTHTHTHTHTLHTAHTHTVVGPSASPLYRCPSLHAIAEAHHEPGLQQSSHQP